jgi:hypothetical protein
MALGSTGRDPRLGRCERYWNGAGAARGIRTPDPIITNDVLYQLSYCGLSCLEPETNAPERALLPKIRRYSNPAPARARRFGGKAAQKPIAEGGLCRRGLYCAA